jgi:glutamate racemase
MSADHIVEIFRRVLNTPEVDASSDFFELGGDSLLATRVLSAIARDFGAELLYEDFFENPSADGLFAKVCRRSAMSG